MTTLLRQSPSGPETLLSTDDIVYGDETVTEALARISGDIPPSSSQVQNASIIPGPTVTEALTAIADPVTTDRIADQAFTRSKLNGGIIVALTTGLPFAGVSTANLSAGSFTIDPGTTVVGDTYHAHFFWEAVHTAAATPQIILEFVRNGIVLGNLFITPDSVAGTYHGTFDSYFRYTAIGTTGSAVISLATSNTLSFAIGGWLPSVSAPIASLNTTINQTLEWRMRMGTAVSGNNLIVYQAYVEKLINS